MSVTTTTAATSLTEAADTMLRADEAAGRAAATRADAAARAAVEAAAEPVPKASPAPRRQAPVAPRTPDADEELAAAEAEMDAAEAMMAAAEETYHNTFQHQPETEEEHDELERAAAALAETLDRPWPRSGLPLGAPEDSLDTQAATEDLECSEDGECALGSPPPVPASVVPPLPTEEDDSDDEVPPTPDRKTGPVIVLETPPRFPFNSPVPRTPANTPTTPVTVDLTVDTKAEFMKAYEKLDAEAMFAAMAPLLFEFDVTKAEVGMLSRELRVVNDKLETAQKLYERREKGFFENMKAAGDAIELSSQRNHQVQCELREKYGKAKHGYRKYKRKYDELKNATAQDSKRAKSDESGSPTY